MLRRTPYKLLHSARKSDQEHPIDRLYAPLRPKHGRGRAVPTSDERRLGREKRGSVYFYSADLRMLICGEGGRSMARWAGNTLTWRRSQLVTRFDSVNPGTNPTSPRNRRFPPNTAKLAIVSRALNLHSISGSNSTSYIFFFTANEIPFSRCLHRPRGRVRRQIVVRRHFRLPSKFNLHMHPAQ